MNYNANSQSYGSPKGRAAYTAQEEAELREYLIQKRREGMPLRGNVIYWTYPGVNVRHPWQSIRSHAIKFIMPNLPPERSVVVNMANERTSASTTKQIRSSSDLQEERSSKFTPTRPVYNNYRESQEQTFTKDEVKIFRDYLISQRNAGEGLYGSLIYRFYPGLHEHSWNYLREYAIKHIIPKLPDDPNNDRRQSQTSKTTHEVVDDDEFDPKNGSSSVHDIINMDQFQNDKSFEDDNDSQTLSSCETIVEDDSPSPERTRCHFLTNHDADDYYHDGCARTNKKVTNKLQIVNKGKKAVFFHISPSDQATNHTSTSASTLGKRSASTPDNCADSKWKKRKLSSIKN
ncbi:1784_t:CDS:2 [Ambispora leptoticha]|uniref:1784_t:CDS:1 n=1 Tax=Ambispora leptoticha TaxID=144679 RepID=A0A9N9BZG8_9GLOM|nr:1784_t:CDS:2 [Ambispora leptoticha]